MSFYKEVWDTLSKINVNEHVQKKMNLSYLSWAWAWGVLMEHYPESDYQFSDIKKIGDSWEVWVTLNVIDGDKKATRRMWLPVMDFRNDAISEPTSRDINDTRMRCLVKAMAMFGLGHYIYSGEDIPNPISEEKIKEQKEAELLEVCERNAESINVIKEAIADGQHSVVVEAWLEISEEDKKALWVAPTKFKNAPFTTSERSYFKSDEYVAARNEINGV